MARYAASMSSTFVTTMRDAPIRAAPARSIRKTGGCPTAIAAYVSRKMIRALSIPMALNYTKMI